MRKALIPENRFGRYFFHAVGEIVLVMIGILLALQVNTWNDGRKQDKKRSKLVQSLISDFEVTQTRLATSILEAEHINSQIVNFMILAGSNNSSVSVDSLRTLANDGFMRYFPT